MTMKSRTCFSALLGCLLALTVGLMTAGPAAGAAAPVARWSMEEGSGTSTADVTGNGHTGNFAGSPAVSWEAVNVAPVPTGSTAAIQFNNTTGSDDGRIQTNIDNYKGVTGTADRSVSAWVNLDGSGPDNQAFVSWGQNSGGQKWTFRVQANDGTVGAIRTEVNGGFIVGNTDVRGSDWHHVAVTWGNDGSPNINDARLYVDGRRQVISAVKSQSMNTASNTDVRLGMDFVGRPFFGIMDEVAIFDANVPAREIRELATGSTLPRATLDYDAAAFTSGNWQDQVGLPVTNVDPDVDVSNATHGPTGNPQIPSAFSFTGAGAADFLNGFDFENDYVGNATNDSASFELWFRPSDFTGTEMLWELGGGTDGSSLSLDGSTLQLVAKDDGASAAVQTDISALGTSDFIQALSVIDLDDGELSLFVNANPLASVSYSGNDWSGTDGDALAGTNNAAGGTGGALGDLSGYGPFAGDIAMFRYYSDALTADDAAELFAAFQAPAVIPEPSTLLIWSLLAGLAFGAGRRRHKR